MKGGDGRAALCCWPVEFELVGQRFRISGRPAIDWMLKLVDEDWLAIVPGMVEGDDIDELIDYGLVDHAVLVAAGRDAAATVCGMPWWAACRLIASVAGDVELAGALVLASVDPGRVSIGAYVAAVYRLMIADQDKKHRAMVDMEIMRVPKGVRTEDLYDPQRAATQFERAFARQQHDM